jgi:HPt (histidine-containing phosphotransfer) domain-containing protein
MNADILTVINALPDCSSMESGKPTAAPPAVLDDEALAQLRELQIQGEPDLVAEILNLFLADTPARLAAIGEAFQARDAAAVARGAHALKGATASIGARRMTTLCEALEANATVQTLTDAGATLTELEEEFQRVRAALEAERNT